jgi:hypothetical protein
MCVQDSTSLEQGLIAGGCQQGNECLGPINDGDIISKKILLHEFCAARHWYFAGGSLSGSRAVLDGSSYNVSRAHKGICEWLGLMVFTHYSMAEWMHMSGGDTAYSAARPRSYH